MNDVFVFDQYSGMLLYHKRYDSIVQKYQHISESQYAQITASFLIKASAAMGKLHYVEMERVALSFYTRGGYCVSCVYARDIGPELGEHIGRQVAVLLGECDRQTAQKTHKRQKLSLKGQLRASRKGVDLDVAAFALHFNKSYN